MNKNTDTQKLSKITPQNVNFARWYTDVLVNGKLIEYGIVRGTIIMKPNSYGIWENFQTIFNQKIKNLGVNNVYVPMLIPQSLMDMERDHIIGFAPELATVTQIGEKKLKEVLYTRPTSEVLFCRYFASQVQSYRDFPILTNQWANVIRWEKTTNPFLRNTEFLWQEGHTIHATSMEARRFTRRIWHMQQKILRKYFAIPTMIGKKTAHEKFAGACSTYTCEAMMKDGKALQSATSHYLAQNFSKPFNIKFRTINNEWDFAYQTSWGISTRILGALIMTHGDDRGIIIPPRVAPTQVDILVFNPKLDENLDAAVRAIQKSLKTIFRVRVDFSTATLGYKAGESEIQGTPVRIEIGPRDFANQVATVVRRDTLEKITVPLTDLKKQLKKILDDVHESLLAAAEERMQNNIVHVAMYEELKIAIANNHWAIAPFCCKGDEEQQIQNDTTASARLVVVLNPNEMKTENKKPCIYCKKITKRQVLFAKAY